MNVFLLYLILLKATATSFSGLASLPMIHDDLVIRHHVLTDHQLATAVAAGRLSPGPLGNYVVSAGYLVAGIPGAIAGWLAMITPAFLVLPLIRFVGAKADHPNVKGPLTEVIRWIVLAGAGLLLSAAVPLGREALQSGLTKALAAAALTAAVFTRLDSLLITLAAGALGLAAYAVA